ncbi:hypothetical protein HT031_005023 [Scenedesmus sp. PABB004]|nr:hypothetical protein HT031_005023 [Scenedesmus sp. PABB004]
MGALGISPIVQAGPADFSSVRVLPPVPGASFLGGLPPENTVVPYDVSRLQYVGDGLSENPDVAARQVVQRVDAYMQQAGLNYSLTHVALVMETSYAPYKHAGVQSDPLASDEQHAAALEADTRRQLAAALRVLTSDDVRMKTLVPSSHVKYHVYGSGAGTEADFMLRGAVLQTCRAAGLDSRSVRVVLMTQDDDWLVAALGLLDEVSELTLVRIGRPPRSDGSHGSDTLVYRNLTTFWQEFSAKLGLGATMSVTAAVVLAALSVGDYRDGSAGDLIRGWTGKGSGGMAARTRVLRAVETLVGTGAFSLAALERMIEELTEDQEDINVDAVMARVCRYIVQAAYSANLVLREVLLGAAVCLEGAAFLLGAPGRARAARAARRGAAIGPQQHGCFDCCAGLSRLPACL